MTATRDALGERMKSDYEARTRLAFPRRTWTIVRVDGRAFHTYTRGLPRLFDPKLARDMADTAQVLCAEIQNARFAYTQSDEISVAIFDGQSPNTAAWFDGDQQKIVSISASAATAAFNARRESEPACTGHALFDSRAFTIPDPVEVGNYFVWRQFDARRNATQAAGQAVLGRKAVHGLPNREIQDRLHAAGTAWDDYPAAFRYGQVVVRRPTELPATDPAGPPVTRHRWMIEDAPWFAGPEHRWWLDAALCDHADPAEGGIPCA